MKTAYTINALGLLFDIIAALILAKYGLPPDVNPAGTSALLLESIDDVEIDKGKRYKKLSKIGIAILIIGFALQFGVCIYFIVTIP